MNRLPPAFKRYHRTRRETLRLVEDLTQEQLDFSSSPRKWSAGQVLDHLTRIDELFQRECNELLKRWKKRGGAVSLNRSLSDEGISLPLVPDVFLPLFDVPVAMAGIFFPRPVREAILGSRVVPARAPERIQPRSGRPGEDLRRELSGFLDYLEGCASGYPRVDWKRLRYYSPMFGMTNLPGLLSVLASHEKRHQGQLQDILDAGGFPAAE